MTLPAEDHTANYSIRPMVEGDVPQLAVLQRAVFSRRRDLGEIRATLLWKYFRNPAGVVVASVACDAAGQIIGVYGGIPLRMQIGMVPTLAVEIVATAVHPEVRARGLMRALHASFRKKRSELATWEVTFGFPNPLALSIGIKSLDYQYRWSINRFSVSLRLVECSVQLGGVCSEREIAKRFVARALRKVFDRCLTLKSFRRHVRASCLQISEVSDVPEDIDALWERARAGYPNAVIRDHEYLRWRIFQEPYTRNKLFTARIGGELVGYFALTVGSKVTVVDFFCSRDTKLIGELVRAMLTTASELPGSQELDWVVSDINCAKALLPFSPRVTDVLAFVWSETVESSKSHRDADRSYDWNISGNEFLLG